MQQHFTYDELTPLEQCIAEFMAKQKNYRAGQRESLSKKYHEEERLLDA